MKRLLFLFALVLFASPAFAAWVTTVDEKVFINGQLRVHVVYTDAPANKKFDRTYLLSGGADAGTELDNAIRAELVRQNALTASEKKISVGVRVVPPVAPAAAVTPSTDAALNAFQAALAKYRRTKAAFDAGVVTAQELDAAKADLKAKYKPAYLVNF